MPGSSRSFAVLVLAGVLAACASSTTPPPTGDPTPLQGVPVRTLEGIAEGYTGGAANVAGMEIDDGTLTWHLGSTVGSIDADGAFSLELTDALPNGTLFTANADEIAELYGECLTLSRSWRTGGRIEAYAGDDLQTRTSLANVRMYDANDPVTSVDLTYVRPVPADATVVLTVRLPIEGTLVTEAGASEPNPVVVECGDDVHVVELVEGWYWNVIKTAVTAFTAPNGDEVEYQIITRFEVGGEAPEGLRFVALNF